MILLCAGCSDKQISRGLGIAQSTVHVHVGAIYEKLGARGRVAAVTAALRTGVCQLPVAPSPHEPTPDDA